MRTALSNIMGSSKKAEHGEASGPSRNSKSGATTGGDCRRACAHLPAADPGGCLQRMRAAPTMNCAAQARWQGQLWVLGDARQARQYGGLLSRAGARAGSPPRQPGAAARRVAAQ
jgi:hypothetical protein